MNNILMQFGRRCAQCDAYFLASVQVARGLTTPDSVWGRVLSNTVNDSRIRWIQNVTSRLRLMGLFDEVVSSPATFLEKRKEYGITFSQWCHHRHLALEAGNSADNFQVGPPYSFFSSALRRTIIQNEICAAPNHVMLEVGPRERPRVPRILQRMTNDSIQTIS